MNVIKPSFTDIKTGLGTFFSGLGLMSSVLLVIVIVALFIFATDTVTGAFAGWRSNREVQKLKNEAAAWQKKAEDAHIEAEQFKGAAAAYKQEGTALQSQLTELQHARPELQQRSTASGRRVEQIRSTAIRPIGSDIKQRVDALGSNLDSLYPD